MCSLDARTYTFTFSNFADAFIQMYVHMWVFLPAYNPQRAYQMCKGVKTVPEMVRIAAHMEIRCKETPILMPVLNCKVMSSY